MKTRFRKSHLVIAFGALMLSQGAMAQTHHWQNIAGIVQAGNVVGTGDGAIIGGPTPWSTLSGQAVVVLERGDIGFEVRGLVLAGGNGIGTRGAIAQVKGTLVCDTNASASGGSSVVVDTPLVDLDEEGNARFSGNVGALPAVCFTEPDVAFLIRVGSGRWIANGAVLR
jgi:hypothetical protein